MPELPEVETILQGLREHALGQRVTAVEVRNPAVVLGSLPDFIRDVRGGSIVGLKRKGKVLAIRLARGNRKPPQYLVVRLGMTGQFTVVPCESPVELHTHIRLMLGKGKEELRFRDVRRFGRLRCCVRGELEEVFGRLGPDAREITEDQFLAALRGRRGAIKSWLMNQQFLSGIGNIYADEALFAARIHPLTPAGRLPLVAARRLHRAVRRILDRAIAWGGTSVRDYLDAEGQRGDFLSQLRVYQRTGEPCRRCRRLIQRLIIGGRSSHFCRHCQPRPRWVAVRRSPRKVAVLRSQQA
ncbi:MAG: bifunctional DNA-formamidopyrimidine glycosylase/DNA-(apurinic or apyrimidinic site) lyase [Terriglobia bacterium]